jgi:hypothetical protein
MCFRIVLLPNFRSLENPARLNACALEFAPTSVRAHIIVLPYDVRAPADSRLVWWWDASTQRHTLNASLGTNRAQCTQGHSGINHARYASAEEIPAGISERHLRPNRRSMFSLRRGPGRHQHSSPLCNRKQTGYETLFDLFPEESTSLYRRRPRLPNSGSRHTAFTTKKGQALWFE